MKKTKKLHTVLLPILICMMLVGCGKNDSGERNKSGELMLNTVESDAELQYTSNGMDLEEKPNTISQVISIGDGFLLLGEQKGHQILTGYDIEGKITERYDMSWLQENQEISRIQAGENGSIYALVYTSFGKDEFCYELYTIKAGGDSRTILLCAA